MLNLKTLFKKKTKDEPAAPEDDDASAKAATPGEAAAEGEEGAEVPAKKKPNKLILIGAAAAVVLLLGGGTAAFLAMSSGHYAAKPGKPKGEKPAEGGDKKGDPSAPQIKDGPDGVVFYTLPSVVVNMQTADGRPTFLKLKLTLELPDHDTADVLTPNLPRLQDMFQTFLRELRPEDLSGSQGSYQLRLEILRRVNLVIAPSKVNAVLIEEMLIN